MTFLLLALTFIGLVIEFWRVFKQVTKEDGEEDANHEGEQ